MTNKQLAEPSWSQQDTTNAHTSNPASLYSWFIHTYKRSLRLFKLQSEFFRKELNGLINQAVNPDNPFEVRQTAIFQLQDYLSGDKWSNEQAANSSAILEAFSSIIYELIAIKGQARMSQESCPLLDAIGAVMRDTLKSQDGQPTLKVLDNNLSALNLSYLDLTAVDFSGLNCQQVKFVGAKLNHANFEQTTLRLAVLDNAELKFVNLSRANLSSAKLCNTDLYQADLTHAHCLATDFSNADLIHSNLNYASLEFAVLTHANLFDADLSHAQFNYANLDHANLDQATLTNATFDYAEFEGVSELSSN